jgi:phenylglyoxylate dehydrogenase epsilon subunit
MQTAKYLIVGSSHAAIEALDAVRLSDPEGAVILATRDPALPYSPTLLPYVVSGRTDAKRMFLRDQGYFEAQRVTLKRAAELVSLDPGEPLANFRGGEVIRYEKLLLATGAVPAVPRIAGLERVRFHVLRTLQDAIELRAALVEAKKAVILGAGLVGMHAAENLVKAGAEVTIVELQPRVLAGYFDERASALIERAFTERGARILCGSAVTQAHSLAGGFALELSDGERVEGELLVVGTGVTPAIGYLDGSGIEARHGIVVDERMRTSRPGVWAAGDVAEAPGFYDGMPVVNGILPNAAEQGRIAGMDMAGDSRRPAFPGAVPINTYHFFGRQALSVGSFAARGGQSHEAFDVAAGRYQKLVLKDDRLQAISSIGRPFDPGIMLELIRRRVDLAPVKAAFLARPQDTARSLMSAMWR